MEKKKMSNKKLAIIISSIVVVILIGVTIAYFSSRSSSVAQSIKTGSLNIVYENENTFRLNNLKPIKDSKIKEDAAEISFTIKNYGQTEAYAHVNLIDIAISDNFKNESFKWALYQEETLIKEGDFSAIGTNTSLNLYKDIPFQPDEGKNYTIYIWISENKQDQSSMMNGSFKGKVEILGYAEPSYYVDNSGANAPVLASGMIPVVYDETSGNWEVANIEEEWYNYDEQWWANAVTTSEESYRTAEVGTEIPMEDINSMWVWIPRYKYKIPSNIGSSSNVTSPPEIDVVFESGTETTGSTLSSCPITSTSCYYTHPAFRDGSKVYKTTAYDQGGWDEELEGIWIGKFETGTEGDTCSSSPSEANCQNVTPVIKPDVISLRHQNVSTAFDTSLKFAGGTRNTSNGTVTFSGNSTYGLTSSTDTHMIKNTEWGAVAYLSQSKYGKMGNSNYSGANKEIYINNSGNISNYNTYTGRSGGSPSASGTTYGSYSYNDKACTSSTCTGSVTTNAGQGASTTGTIYGIYDMSGGAHDRTMGNWAGTVGSSGFTTSNFPGGSSGSKYYEKYTGTSSISITSEKSIKGDAIYETMRWYSDYALFPYASTPWSSRGGSYFNTSRAGAFYSSSNGGTSTSSHGFRVALIP